MSLTELEQTIYAYYVDGEASVFATAPRFYPHGELVLVLADKITVATRKFGFKVTGKAKNVAGVFLDELIAAGAYSSKTNDFGGTMHQFQGDVYKQFLKGRQDSDPIIAKAKAGGPDFWEQAFAALTQ